MSRPVAGKHYPRSIGEFSAWFGTDADCLDDLEWLRWPGFVCPRVRARLGLAAGRRTLDVQRQRRPDIADGGHDLRSHPDTADGVVMACWLFTSQKDGISARSVQRSLEIGSYQTTWAMLHRLRSMLVRPGRELLHGRVEVDAVITDGWQGYRPATWKLYTHERIAVRGAKASDLLPGVHRIASLAQRWLLGTHQGAVDEAHLTSYLDEFVFRFNRRRSRSRGMLFYRVLELAATHEPVRYRPAWFT